MNIDFYPPQLPFLFYKRQILEVYYYYIDCYLSSILQTGLKETIDASTQTDGGTQSEMKTLVDRGKSVVKRPRKV